MNGTATLDRQSATLEIARRLSRDYPEISCLEANLLEWQTSDRYDIVLSGQVIEHVARKAADRRLFDRDQHLVLARQALDQIGVERFEETRIRHGGGWINT